MCSSGGLLPRPLKSQLAHWNSLPARIQSTLACRFSVFGTFGHFGFRSFDCHILSVDPPAIGFRCSYGWRAFAALLEQVRFMATEPHVITRCLRAFLHLPGLTAIQDLIDAKGSSVGPANNQRVNSPLVGYMHNNANVHFMHARSSSLFHLVVHAIYYRTIVR